MINPHLLDPEIKDRKKIADLLDPIEFEKLLGKVLLFDPEVIEARHFSGVVKAALYHFEEDKSILSVLGRDLWLTLKLTDQEFLQAMEHCWLVCGQTPEESFIPYA